MNARPWVQDLKKPAVSAQEMCCITPLPLEDAAKLSALADLFPNQSQEQIISTLLAHALDQVT